MIFIAIVAFAGLLAICVVVSASNNLVRLERLTQEAWAGIDIALKRRHDLIPNLVATVKGYATHEREALESLVLLRNEATASGSLDGRVAAEAAIGIAITKLLGRVEAYPELRSSAHFLELQKELVNTEDRIAAARRFYNNNIRDFNVAIETFPGSMVKGNRQPKPLFTLEDPSERATPTLTI